MMKLILKREQNFVREIFFLRLLNWMDSPLSQSPLEHFEGKLFASFAKSVSDEDVFAGELQETSFQGLVEAFLLFAVFDGGAVHGSF